MSTMNIARAATNHNVQANGSSSQSTNVQSVLLQQAQEAFLNDNFDEEDLKNELAARKYR